MTCLFKFFSICLQTNSQKFEADVFDEVITLQGIGLEETRRNLASTKEIKFLGEIHKILQKATILKNLMERIGLMVTNW